MLDGPPPADAPGGFTPPPTGPSPGGFAPPPPPPHEPGRPGNPWEQRASLGILAGLAQAVKGFVVTPYEAFSRTRERGDVLSPLTFLVLLGWAGVVAGQVWSLALRSLLLPLLPPELSSRYASLTLSVVGFVGNVLLGPALVLIGAFLWTLVLHLSLTLVGGVQRSDAGFEGTFRAVAYASVANLAQVLPLVGGLAAFIWSIVLQAIGLARLHRTTEGRAFLALLIPLVLCCCCAIGAVLSLISLGAFAAAGLEAR
jgi:hypothetical protein